MTDPYSHLSTEDRALMERVDRMFQQKSDDRAMLAFRIRLRRLAKQWREAGDEQAAKDLDDFLDEAP